MPLFWHLFHPEKCVSSSQLLYTHRIESFLLSLLNSSNIAAVSVLVDLHRNEIVTVALVPI